MEGRGTHGRGRGGSEGEWMMRRGEGPHGPEEGRWTYVGG
jgi:hypothetical protein